MKCKKCLLKTETPHTATEEKMCAAIVKWREKARRLQAEVWAMSDDERITEGAGFREEIEKARSINRAVMDEAVAYNRGWNMAIKTAAAQVKAGNLEISEIEALEFKMPNAEVRRGPATEGETK